MNARIMKREGTGHLYSKAAFLCLESVFQSASAFPPILPTRFSSLQLCSHAGSSFNTHSDLMCSPLMQRRKMYCRQMHCRQMHHLPHRSFRDRDSGNQHCSHIPTRRVAKEALYFVVSHEQSGLDSQFG